MQKHYGNLLLANFVNQRVLLLGAPTDQALLNDIRGKLVLSVFQHVATEAVHNAFPVLRDAMLDDVLDDVVPVLVRDECEHVLVQLFQHGAGNFKNKKII